MPYCEQCSSQRAAETETLHFHAPTLTHNSLAMSDSPRQIITVLNAHQCLLQFQLSNDQVINHKISISKSLIQNHTQNTVKLIMTENC